MSQCIHVTGFQSGDMSVSASVVNGSVSEVAMRTLDKIRSFGHDVTEVATVRLLDGPVREVHATVTMRGSLGDPMWHRFLTPSSPWPTLPEETAA